MTDRDKKYRTVVMLPVYFEWTEDGTVTSAKVDAMEGLAPDHDSRFAMVESDEFPDGTDMTDDEAKSAWKALIDSGKDWPVGWRT